MTSINLRDFYYWYTQDEYIEVSDEVAEALRASVRYEAAYAERARYNKAFYSLDCDDGIEYSVCQHELTPDEVLELKERFCRLWNALNSLPETQGRRVGRSLYPRHDLPGDCSGRGRGQERGAALRPERHRADEKISAKKSVIAVSMCSTFLVVYERKFFLSTTE